MYKFTIRNNRLKENILVFLYKHKNHLKSVDCNYEIKLNTIDKMIKYNIGHGEYTYEDNIFITYKEEEKPQGTETSVEYFERLILTAKNIDTIEKFIDNVEEFSKKKDIEEKNLYIFVPNEYGEWITYNKIPSRTLESIYINNKIKKKIKDEINLFINSENEYNKYGIPYKKTFLLTGIAGSGKTSLVKAICTEFGYNLCMLSISKKFDNESLMMSIKYLENKSILLIEDIDSLFLKRDATADNPGITFSHLINILDGVLYKHGIIIFLTTNHPENLDHAILRIGRVDSIFQMNYPNKNEIESLFCDMHENIINEEEIKEQFNLFYSKIENKKLPMAAIVNFLFTYKSNWKDNINELIDTNNYIRDVLKESKNDTLYV